jgi:hypothetical protein
MDNIIIGIMILTGLCVIICVIICAIWGDRIITWFEERKKK